MVSTRTAARSNAASRGRTGRGAVERREELELRAGRRPPAASPSNVLTRGRAVRGRLQGPERGRRPRSRWQHRRLRRGAETVFATGVARRSDQTLHRYAKVAAPRCSGTGSTSASVARRRWSRREALRVFDPTRAAPKARGQARERPPATSAFINFARQGAVARVQTCNVIKEGRLTGVVRATTRRLALNHQFRHNPPSRANLGATHAPIFATRASSPSSPPPMKFDAMGLAKLGASADLARGVFAG